MTGGSTPARSPAPATITSAAAIRLSVGGNDRSTEVSGVIADNNPCGCTPGPGALEKVGLGTMILSGANTYTGGTTITAGTLQLGNGGARIDRRRCRRTTPRSRSIDPMPISSPARSRAAARFSRTAPARRRSTAVNTYSRRHHDQRRRAGALRRGQHRQFERRDQQRHLRHFGHHRAEPRSRTCPARAS